MAKWFRSEDMAYVSIIVNEDAAHTCISDLGKLGMIQFTDLNPDLTAFQRRYVAYIKRIDELERKLNFFGEEVRCKSVLRTCSRAYVRSACRADEREPRLASHLSVPFLCKYNTQVHSNYGVRYCISRGSTVF